MRLLCSMLQQMDPDRLEMQIRVVASQRRTILQNLMASVGILKQAVLSVSAAEHMEVVDLSLSLIDLLCQGENIFTLEILKEFLVQ